MNKRDTHNRISLFILSDLDCLLNIFRRTQRGSGLQEHDIFWLVIFIIGQPLNCMKNGINTQAIVTSKFNRAKKGNFGSPLSTYLCNFGIVC